MAQIIATLLGFLIAFFILRIQATDQQRDVSYRLYRSEMDRLIDLASHLPPSMVTLRRGLMRVIDDYAFRRLDELPEFRSGHDDVHPWTITSMEFSDAASGIYSKDDSEDQLYLRRIMLCFDNIERTISAMVEQYIHIIIISIVKSSIIRLTELLVSSLALLVLFSVHDVFSMLPQLSIPLLLAYFTCMLITIADWIFHTNMIYRDLQGPWEFPDNV